MPPLVLELCIRLQMKSFAYTIFVMTTTLPHAPTLYWNYVLGYEIRHTDHFCCHDIDPPPDPHPLTLPPTLYWNYVLCYK